jgi:hypothetical protein
VDTALGTATVDVDTGELIELEPGAVVRGTTVEGITLPRVVAADAHGSRIVAVVDRKPPLVVSDDAGATWRETGGGLPPGVTVAISPAHPDVVAYASDTRIFVSEDGGRFWRALPPELVGIRALRWDI